MKFEHSSLGLETNGEGGDFYLISETDIFCWFFSEGLILHKQKSLDSGSEKLKAKSSLYTIRMISNTLSRTFGFPHFRKIRNSKRNSSRDIFPPLVVCPFLRKMQLIEVLTWVVSHFLKEIQSIIFPFNG